MPIGDLDYVRAKCGAALGQVEVLSWQLSLTVDSQFEPRSREQTLDKGDPISRENIGEQGDPERPARRGDLAAAMRVLEKARHCAVPRYFGRRGRINRGCLGVHTGRGACNSRARAPIAVAIRDMALPWRHCCCTGVSRAPREEWAT